MSEILGKYFLDIVGMEMPRGSSQRGPDQRNFSIPFGDEAIIKVRYLKR